MAPSGDLRRRRRRIGGAVIQPYGGYGFTENARRAARRHSGGDFAACRQAEMCKIVTTRELIQCIPAAAPFNQAKAQTNCRSGGPPANQEGFPAPFKRRKPDRGTTEPLTHPSGNAALPIHGGT